MGAQLSGHKGARSRWVVKSLPILAGAYAVVAGTISLMGWVLDKPFLYDWDRDGISIKANPSICVMIAGFSLLFWAISERTRLIVRTTGVVISVIGALTLSQHVFGIDLGIDTLLFDEAPGARATASPGRMGVPASAAFILIGIAIVFLTYERLRGWTSALGTLTLAISALSLVGYGFGVDQLFTFTRITSIAWQTATMLAAIGLGLMAAVPERGIAEVYGRMDAGGAVFRRLLLPIVVIAVMLSWIRIMGENAGLYESIFGTAMRTIIEIALMVGLLWLTSNGVSRSDREVRQQAQELADRDVRMRGVLDSLSDTFMTFDSELRITYMNSAIKKLFTENGITPSDVMGSHVFDVFREARGTKMGEELINTHKNQVPADFEAFYEPFGRWFHARYLPTPDGGLSLFALDITERKQAEQLVTRRAHELAVLYGFTDSLNRAANLTDVYEAALNTISSTLDCQRASILLFDDKGVMSFVASRGLSEDYKRAVNGHSPWAAGTKGARPIATENIEKSELDAGLKSVITAEGIAALGFIPLIANETLIGKFMVYYNEPHNFAEAEFEIAMTIGYQIAVGVERKRTEESLRENEERLRIATQTGKVGVWDWDIKSNFVAWTESVYKMHGVALGDFDGSVESFSSYVHPEDRDFVKERIGMALSGESSYDIEFRVLKPDGGTNWLFTNAIVLRDGTGPYRMIGATVDITERKMAEQESARLAAIVDSSGDAIVSKDLDGIITSWNRGAERLFGYNAEEVIGKPITMLMPADKTAEELDILERVRRGEHTDHYETIRLHKNGTLLHVSLSISPISDASGRIFGASKIARDITQRKETEAALRDREIMQRIVEAQEAERHRIARDLHDHLGQQLTALRLKLESLKSKCSDNEDLAGDVDETQRMASKIDVDINYLAWELRPTELDQLGLSDALGSFVREWSKTYGIDAEFHASPDDTGRLHPDLETNLYRIVQEGLNNILKHARAMSVSVLLEARDDRIVLIIEDDGEGFDPEMSHGNGRSPKGLGLLGMRERTAMLGGDMEIESRPGGGTTIYIRVPRRSAEGEIA